ncbi:MAG: NAD(P)H-hydrate epimerase [Planctomycetes bacterium]|nr:NAD(P)H-hydrate epimerase [Planctomycetota bacterium]
MPRARSTGQRTAMPPVLSPGQCREVDRLCARKYGLPTIVLMETAGAAVADSVLELPGGRLGRGVLVVAGGGNNGGDALVCARYLANARVAMAVVLIAARSKLAPETRTHLKICERMGIAVHEGAARSAIQNAMADLGKQTPGALVDGLFGTGLSRDVTGRAAAAIDCINELSRGGCAVVSVDIPSGLDAETGRELGVAVRADRTVTFVGIKKGMLSKTAERLVGEVEVVDIGVPRAAVDEVLGGDRAGRRRG